MPVMAVVYLVGVAVALWRVDGPPATRVVLALLWPVGIVAFAVTAAILLLAAIPLFPWFGATVAAIAAVAWWLMEGRT